MQVETRSCRDANLRDVGGKLHVSPDKRRDTFDFLYVDGLILNYREREDSSLSVSPEAACAVSCSASWLRGEEILIRLCLSFLNLSDDLRMGLIRCGTITVV